MPRKSHYNIPVPEWKCPQCGFIHKAVDLLRLDSDNLVCAAVVELSPAVPVDPPAAETRPSANLKTKS
jgi:hypothetical protein